MYVRNEWIVGCMEVILVPNKNIYHVTTVAFCVDSPALFFQSSYFLCLLVFFDVFVLWNRTFVYIFPITSLRSRQHQQNTRRRVGIFCFVSLWQRRKSCWRFNRKRIVVAATGCSTAVAIDWVLGVRHLMNIDWCIIRDVFLIAPVSPTTGQAFPTHGHRSDLIQLHHLGIQSDFSFYCVDG